MLIEASVTSESRVTAEAPAVFTGHQDKSAAGWWRHLGLILAIGDGLSMAFAVLLSRLLTTEAGQSFSAVGHSWSGTLAASMVPGWVLTMAAVGAYQRRSLGWSEEYRRVFDAAVRFLVLIAAVAFFLRLGIGRGFVLAAVGFAAASGLLLRFLLRRLVHRGRGRGRFVRRVLVVGSRIDSIELVRQMQATPHAGLRPIGACTPEGDGVLHFDGHQLPVVAGPDSILEAVVMSSADAVAVADSSTLSNGALRHLAWQLEGTGVDLMVTPSLTDVAGPRISIRPVSDLPLLHVEEPELKGTRRVAKETVDRVCAATGLVVMSPLMLLLALLVRLTSRGPILFRQVRVGLAGRPFTIYKFRTMARDAEARLAELEHLNEHDGVLFKISCDPRITSVGRVLRRWSLDELPQLWNVLRGDMSIVGPRPPLPSEVERYSRDVRRRLLVKPGLTGLWQVSGRAGLSWDEAVRLDLFYVENWSLTLDIVIIARTVSAVLKRHGAC